MTTITLQKAQQDLPALIKRALAGEDIVIEVDDQKIRLAQVTSNAFDETVADRSSSSRFLMWNVVSAVMKRPIREGSTRH